MRHPPHTLPGRTLPRRTLPGRLLPALLLIAPLAAGCSFLQQPTQMRGNHIDADLLQQLTPGTSSRADVVALVGSPTTHATFDDNTWIYVSQVTRPLIARTNGVEQQNVVVMTFNEQGTLQGIRKLDQADGLPVDVVARSTPSPGNDASILQQLLGNVGRFNAGGAAGATQPTAPSGGAPTPGGL